MIPHTEDDTKQHVNNSKDDGYFHFVRIIEVDLVGGDLPHGIQAEWIRILAVLCFVSRVQGYFLRHQYCFTANKSWQISASIFPFLLEFKTAAVKIIMEKNVKTSKEVIFSQVPYLKTSATHYITD